MAVNFQKVVATNVIETIDKQFVTNAEKQAIDALGTASTKNTGTNAGEIPLLDDTGKLVGSILPDLSITDVFVVSSEAEMLGLTQAKTGDVAIRTDLTKTFILSTVNYDTLTDWKEILTPMAPVTSVAGKTGAVTLNITDITGLTTALSGKLDSSSLSTDITLGGTSSSDLLTASQKAVKSYVDNVIAGLQQGTIANLSSTTETVTVSSDTAHLTNTIKGISIIYVVNQGIIQGDSFTYSDKTITFKDTTLDNKSIQVTYMY